ncbi:MAG: hypothetical protein QOF78_1068 [Phycisphaerales bacterium]|nr:hypothetical protein [Phycisphaerales bacterium]
MVCLMIKTTMTIGVLLCGLGFVTYWFWAELGGDHQSPTALIPAGFGALLLLLGFGALVKPGMRKHFMHVAVALGLLGFLASFPMGVMGLVKKGAKLGPLSQLIMAALTGAYVAMGVRSFIAAKRARQAGERANSL